MLLDIQTNASGLYELRPTSGPLKGLLVATAEVIVPYIETREGSQLRSAWGISIKNDAIHDYPELLQAMGIRRRLNVPPALRARKVRDWRTARMPDRDNAEYLAHRKEEGLKRAKRHLDRV